MNTNRRLAYIGLSLVHHLRHFTQKITHTLHSTINHELIKIQSQLFCFLFFFFFLQKRKVEQPQLLYIKWLKSTNQLIENMISKYLHFRHHHYCRRLQRRTGISCLSLKGLYININNKQFNQSCSFPFPFPFPSFSFSW